MLDGEKWRTVVALWTLIAAVVVITWTALTGPLMPVGAVDSLGIVALGLVFVAHALPLGVLLTRRTKPAASPRLRLVGDRA